MLCRVKGAVLGPKGIGLVVDSIAVESQLCLIVIRNDARQASHEVVLGVDIELSCREVCRLEQFVLEGTVSIAVAARRGVIDKID